MSKHHRYTADQLADVYKQAGPPLGIGRRPVAYCTCPDRVGLDAWVESGCELHGSEAGAQRFVAASLDELDRRARAVEALYRAALACPMGAA